MLHSALPELPYFPRSPLDETCLGHLGMNKGVSMFAPRRRGKTSFVVNELLPAAEHHGYRTVYVDLWERQPAPGLAITEALEAIGGKHRYQVASAKVQAKLKAPFLEAGGEVVGKPVPAKPSDLLRRLKTAMAGLSSRHDWLIVIDEFQALAHSPVDGFIAALRTGFQAHPRVKMFLTGSSRRGLSNMLTSQRSPFLGMAMPVDLPELDRTFITARCGDIKNLSGRTMDPDALMAVFERILRVPEYLNQIVSIILVEGRYDAEEAYQRWTSVLGQGEAANLWVTLSELDRKVLTLLAHDPGAKVFTESTRKWLGAQLKGELVSSSRVQGVVKRFTRSGYLQPGQDPGEYELANDELRLFVTQFQPRPRLRRSHHSTPKR